MKLAGPGLLCAGRFLITASISSAVIGLFRLSASSHISSLATPFPIPYFISAWLFSNYLLVLVNPLTSSPILPQCLPSDNDQNVLHLHESVSVLLVCLVCFLDSIVDRYVFIAILLFIVLILFFLNKSL